MQKAATFKAEIPSSLPNRRVAAVRIEFVQAWREEVGVLPSVPRPADERDSITDVEGYLRRTARGAEVPVIGVASLNAGASPPAIRRKDHRRVVSVAADVDPAVMSGDEANNILANPVLADLTAVNPDPTYMRGGDQQQRLESLDAPYRGFAIALIMIAALLATPLLLERAIQARFPIGLAASLACGILIVAALCVIVVSARSTVHLHLIAARGRSGVRAAPGIQMQGGHGWWLIRPRVWRPKRSVCPKSSS